MTRPKPAPTYQIHKRSGRAFTTVDHRQIQLGEANSPESRAAFDRLLSEWYANGRRMPQEASRSPDAADGGTTVADVLLAFQAHAEAYYTRPVLDDKGQPRLNPDGSRSLSPPSNSPTTGRSRDYCGDCMAPCRPASSHVHSSKRFAKR